MIDNQLFIDGYELPKPLEKKEVYDLLEKIKQGDNNAIKKLAEHNIRLVISEVIGRFNNVEYDKKDLVSIGNIGLMNAIKTFDVSKKIEFSTYATKCIDNEILIFLRNIKKHEAVDSLDRTIDVNKNGKERKIEDKISNSTNIEEEYCNNEMHRLVREIVNSLPERERKIIMLYFGFYNDKIYTQNEIANILSMSQTNVSRLLIESLKLIAKKLEEKGIIGLRVCPKLQGKTKTKKEVQKKKELQKKKGKDMQTIYQYFNLYSEQQVNEMLEMLSQHEKELVKLRYGEDLNNPISGSLSKSEKDKFYGSLIPKMKRILFNLSKQSVLAEQSKNENERKNVILDIDQKIKEQDEKMDFLTSNAETIIKSDYAKISELLNASSFAEMIRVHSLKEAIIACLKLGYIDGKCFSTLAISKFLEIEQQEVIDTTKKILLAYKEIMNKIIDDAIDNIKDDNKTINESSIKTKIK